MMEELGDASAARRVRSLSDLLGKRLSSMRSGQDLAADADFQELVALLADHADARQRLRWLVQSPDALRCAALAAIVRAGDRSHKAVASLLDRVGYFGMHFALAYLREATEPEVFARMLLRVPGWLWEYPSTREQFFDYLQHMHLSGVAPILAEADAELAWNLEERRDALVDFDVPLVKGFVHDLEQRDRRRAASADADFAHSPLMCRRLDQVVGVLASSHRPCLLLAGDAGTGRTALVRAALRALAGEGWTVVEASPLELLADLQHVHPIQERINTLVAGLGGERQVWHAIAWFQLLDPPSEETHVTLLELLWPHLQSGKLQVVGAVSGPNLRRAGEDIENFSRVFQAIELAPLQVDEVLELAGDWALRHSNRLGTTVIEMSMLEASVGMAARAFPFVAEPGRTLGMLQDALDHALSCAPGSFPLDRDALLDALARRTGLHRELLDDRP